MTIEGSVGRIRPLDRSTAAGHPARVPSRDRGRSLADPHADGVPDGMVSVDGQAGGRSTFRCEHPWDRSRLKRALDLVIAIPSLVLLGPVMLAIAVAVRLDSPGPVLFRQARVGRDRRAGHADGPETPDGPRGVDRRRLNRHGRPFEILKFRTMRSDAEAYAQSPTNGGDSRVTRVGEFLRRSCLDELPQLMNVLRGEMSIVGPRPEMPFIVDVYGPRERRRLEVRPGITGLWQLSGARDRPIHESLELDLEYLENQSFWLDVKIMLRTVAFMAHRKNH